MSTDKQTSDVAAPHRPDAGAASGLPPGSVEDFIGILASLQDQLDNLTATVRRQQQALDRLSAAVRLRDR